MSSGLEACGNGESPEAQAHAFTELCKMSNFTDTRHLQKEEHLGPATERLLKARVASSEHKELPTSQYQVR